MGPFRRMGGGPASLVNVSTTSRESLFCVDRQPDRQTGTAITPMGLGLTQGTLFHLLLPNIGFADGQLKSASNVGSVCGSQEIAFKLMGGQCFPYQ